VVPSPSPTPQLSRQSSRNIGYESDQSSDTAAEDEYGTFQHVPKGLRNANAMPPMWEHQRQESGSAVSRLSQRFGPKGMPVVVPLRTQQPPRRHDLERSPDDDSHSRTSTLHGDDQDYEFPEKTPTARPIRKNPDIPYFTGKSPPLIPLKPSNPDIPYFSLKSPLPIPTRGDTNKKSAVSLDPSGKPNKTTSHAPGPLETQLAAIMSKLVFMEQQNPVVSVTPEDYAEMSSRLKTLEAEKKSLTKRHEAIWALRDEDLENNIRIRGELASARRQLEGITKLRDEDLVNVQVVRIKLADATRELDRLRAQSGRSSPVRNRTSMYMERRDTLERRDTTDLFAVAKAAALQERALELEKRNSDLLSQIQTLKGGANIDDLNRMTAHQAWKDRVNDLEAKLKAKDAEVARLRSSGGSAPSGATGGVEWHRVEAIHEEHAGYREKMGAKLQALRSEKEGLQRELHHKEDECHGLEVKVQSLQRRVGVM
jgi:hypothetical protein